MAISQNGLQHINCFELDYGSRAILACQFQRIPSVLPRV